MERTTIRGQDGKGAVDRASTTTATLIEPLREALARRREALGHAVDDEVLQLACAALQELQASCPLLAGDASVQRAIQRLTSAVGVLRSLVEAQRRADAELEDDAAALIGRTVEELLEARPGATDIAAGRYGRRWSDGPVGGAGFPGRTAAEPSIALASEELR